MTFRLPDHLDLIAGAPDGIRKLRGLILELAVRGKLVPQDPSDEPASELLRRIARERAQLEAEGTCKRSKPMPTVGESEQPFALPEGWAWSRIGELSSVVRGVSYDKSQASENRLSGYLPLLRAHNIDQRLNFDDLVYLPAKLISEDQFIRRGDIVIAMSSGSANLVGKAAQADNDVDFGFGAFCGLIRAHSAELHRHFGLFFQTPLYRNRVAGHGKGIGINNLQKGALLALECPVPPLAEQHRIVAKVDELMALCDRLEAEQADAAAAHARLVETLLGTLTQSADAAELAANWQRLAEHFDTLFTTEASIDALKQTILQLAVMGKLVPQDARDEPASELLKRIAKERARLEAGTTRKKNGITPPVSEGEQPLDLPDGWQWSRIGELASVVRGVSYDKSQSSENRLSGYLPLLRGNNINQRLNFDDLVFVPEHLVSDEQHIRRGDIVIAMSSGSAHLVGKAAQAESDVDSGIGAFCGLIRGYSPELHQYFGFFFQTPLYRNRVAGHGKGIGINNLQKGALLTLECPVPPLAEQHRIVAKVDELMALCDRLKADLAESRTRQARLSAILIESALAAA